MRNKMDKALRAKQFMPFNSLRGYYELVRKKEKVKEKKRELVEEEIDKINYILNTIKKKDMVYIKYYDKDAYSSITGMVSLNDLVYRKIRIVDTEIAFEDILIVDKK